MIVRAAGLEWNVETAGDPDAPALLLLHGFAGSHRTWLPVAPDLARNRFLIMPDLPGHGSTPVCAELSLWQLADALARVCRALTEAPLAIGGYSMGGRIALHVLIRHRAAVQAAIVLGASPGIADNARRATRKRDDDALAARILAEPIEQFVEYWQRQPIFATQHTLPPDVQAAIRAERLACNRAGLAAALRNWGTGVQENLLPPLSEVDVPTLLLAGELDQKFCASNPAMTAIMPRSRLEIITGAGHAAHLEQPSRFVEIVRRFLQNTEHSL